MESSVDTVTRARHCWVVVLAWSWTVSLQSICHVSALIGMTLRIWTETVVPRRWAGVRSSLKKVVMAGATPWPIMLKVLSNRTC